MNRRELIMEVAERADVDYHVAKKVLEAFEDAAVWELTSGVSGIVPLGPTLGVLKNVDFDRRRVRVLFKPSREFLRSARDS